MYSQHPDIARRWEKETPAGELPADEAYDPSKGRERFKTKSGLTLDLEVEPKQDELSVYAYDPRDNDEPVAWIDVDVWPQRKLAKIGLAMVKSSYRAKGIGQAVYPIINRETKKRYGLPLASDDNDKRSEHAEKLWKRLESLGLAHRDEDRYRMEAYVPSLREWFGGL